MKNDDNFFKYQHRNSGHPQLRANQHQHAGGHEHDKQQQHAVRHVLVEGEASHSP